MKVSRRKLLQVLPAAAAGVPLAGALEAQEAPQAGAGRMDRELADARRYLRASVAMVRQVPLPLATEPAVRFVPRN